MNKYYKLLNKIVNKGKTQTNKKGNITYLLNQKLSMSHLDLVDIFDTHPIAMGKLGAELELYMRGETSIAEYNKNGINWWDYCAPNLINSYPTYFKELPKLIDKINTEKRSSKNYVLFIGETGVETNQQPCLSLIQFQIEMGGLNISVYQRSADSNLGLPSDIYQVYLISKMIDVPLDNITFFIGNAHIYQNNLDNTKELLSQTKLGLKPKIKFNLNV